MKGKLKITTKAKHNDVPESMLLLIGISNKIDLGIENQSRHG